MYCWNCGNQINPNAVICMHCGAQQKDIKSSTNKTNSAAVVGFVLSFIPAFMIISFICSVIGAVHADKKYNGDKKGLAIAGAILSSLWIILVIIAMIIVFAAV